MCDYEKMKKEAIVEMIEIEQETLKLLHRLREAIETLDAAHTEEDIKAWGNAHDDFDAGLEYIQVFV